MNINKNIENLDFDIKQIDNTIDILNYLSNGDYLSSNGKHIISRNLSNLQEVQHHLLSLRANLLKEQSQHLNINQCKST